jgi:hypothetical protein
MMVRLGRNRHYIGYEYKVLGVARHSETEEEYVVYRAWYGDGGLWIRPTALFLETVIVDGHSFPRFQFLAVSHRPIRSLHLFPDPAPRLSPTVARQNLPGLSTYRYPPI